MVAQTQLLDNPSFVLRAKRDVFIEDRPIPTIGPKEVLISIEATGICGSDVHYYEHGGSSNFTLTSPMVLGHESSGVVVQAGPDVTRLKVGARVCLEPGVSCTTCEACLSGAYHLCYSMRFAATPPNDGSLCRYYALPEHLAHPLPESMTMEEGAMMEPLSVAVHAIISVAKAKPDANFVVFGAGPVGLLCMAVARAVGAKRVIAVDINPARLEFAKEYAATDTYLPLPLVKELDDSRISYSRRVAVAMKAELGIAERGSGGIDYVIEASGAEACIQIGCLVLRDQGEYIQVGSGGQPPVVPLFNLSTRELVIKTSFRYGAGDYATAIDLVAQGKVSVKPLITHTFPFMDALKAYTSTQKGTGDDGNFIIKAIIDGPK
ncbi:chlorophyll synthesis pathway protein BchC [Cryptococcus sp. DSM 104549]